MSNDAIMNKIQYISKNTLGFVYEGKDAIGQSEPESPICLALLCRLSNRIDTIKFSKDNSKATTKLFWIKLPNMFGTPDPMKDFVKFIEEHLYEFFKDKKVIFHSCKMQCNDNHFMCVIKMEYTEY